MTRMPLAHIPNALFTFLLSPTISLLFFLPYFLLHFPFFFFVFCIVYTFIEENEFQSTYKITKGNVMLTLTWLILKM